MSTLLAGLDIGGSKTTCRIETGECEIVAERTTPSGDWSATPVEDAARWIVAHLARMLPPGAEVVAAGIGAQGCDTSEHAGALARELAATGLAAVVVNDAELLVPAAGLAEGIGVIAGTGSIAVGRDAAGRTLFAGGWGWVLGDAASAPGLVRDATRAALAAHDAGQPNDGLLGALLAAFGVADAAALARSVNDLPTADHWGTRAPAVFAAAERGSGLAAAVIDEAGAALATLVGRLIDRGAVGDDVVAAGSVIANQPRLLVAFRGALAASRPGHRVLLLGCAPVAGAIALARSAASAARSSAVWRGITRST